MDIVAISETHETNKIQLKIPYHTSITAHHTPEAKHAVDREFT